MLKVVIGYRKKKNKDVLPMLLKLRSHAMTFPGYVGSENLVNDKDISIVAVITTWEGAEYFRDWESSRTRRAIIKEYRDCLAEEPKITMYRIIPTRKWMR